MHDNIVKGDEVKTAYSVHVLVAYTRGQYETREAYVCDTQKERREGRKKTYLLEIIAAQAFTSAARGVANNISTLKTVPSGKREISRMTEKLTIKIDKFKLVKTRFKHLPVEILRVLLDCKI